MTVVGKRPTTILYYFEDLPGNNGKDRIVIEDEQNGYARVWLEHRNTVGPWTRCSDVKPLLKPMAADYAADLWEKR